MFHANLSYESDFCQNKIIIHFPFDAFFATFWFIRLYVIFSTWIYFSNIKLLKLNVHIFKFQNTKNVFNYHLIERKNETDVNLIKLICGWRWTQRNVLFQKQFDGRRFRFYWRGFPLLTPTPHKFSGWSKIAKFIVLHRRKMKIRKCY